MNPLQRAKAVALPSLFALALTGACSAKPAGAPDSAAATASAEDPAYHPLSPPPPPRRGKDRVIPEAHYLKAPGFQDCARDGDCLVVPNGCCENDPPISIAVANRAKFEGRFGCEHQRCTRRDRLGPADPVARCVNAQCTIEFGSEGNTFLLDDME